MPQEGDIRLAQGVWQEFWDGQWVPATGVLQDDLWQLAEESPDFLARAQDGEVFQVTAEGDVVPVMPNRPPPEVWSLGRDWPPMTNETGDPGLTSQRPSVVHWSLIDATINQAAREGFILNQDPTSAGYGTWSKEKEEEIGWPLTKEGRREADALADLLGLEVDVDRAKQQYILKLPDKAKPSKGWTLQEWSALSPSEQQAIEARVTSVGLELFFDETSQEIRRQDIKASKTREELEKEAAQQGLVVVWDRAKQTWVKDDPDQNPLHHLVDQAFDRGHYDKAVAFHEFGNIDFNKRPQEAQRLFDEAMRWTQDQNDYAALTSYWQGATGAPAPPGTPEQQRALSRIGLTAAAPPQFDARDIQQGLQGGFPPSEPGVTTAAFPDEGPFGLQAGILQEEPSPIGPQAQALTGLSPFPSFGQQLTPRMGFEGTETDLRDTAALEALQSLGLDPLLASYIASQIEDLRVRHSSALNERAMEEAEAARRRTFTSAQEEFPGFVGSEARAGFIPFRRDPLSFEQAQALSVEAARGSFKQAKFPFQEFLGGEMGRLQREFDVTPQAIAQREAEERRRQQKALTRGRTTFFSPLG